MNDLPNKSKSFNYSTKELLQFLIPSLIGLFLFVIPIPWGGNFSIGVGIMAEVFKENWGTILPGLMTIVVVLSALTSLIIIIFKPKFITSNEFLNELLNISPMWLIFRILGSVFILLTFYELGPAMINSRATGGTILFDLLPTLATWFFFSGFLLPLLLEFGSMDYIGTMIRKVMRPLFKVPGRSAIDGIASWIGSGPVGVVLTNKQYKQGYYTAKEASIISVCFSLVSLPFAVVVAQFLKIDHVFLQFYGAITIASIVAALIIPRIRPISKKTDEYDKRIGKQISEEVPEGNTLSAWALQKGIERSKKAPGIKGLFLEGIKTVIDVYFSLMPLVMAWGTLALIITEYTPIFEWISFPLIYVLEILQVPAAATAAPAILVGFADMFLPAILVANVDFEITRFIIGAVSFTQLIYMTETGAIILKSDIPVGVKDLFIVFLERTAITLPIVVLIAHLVY